MLSKKLLCLLSLAAFQVNSAALSPEHKIWVEELSSKYDISEQVLIDAIGQAKFDENVLAKIQTPWEKKPWYKYAPIFITENRINQGVKYWQQHEDTFAKAEKEYGVPAQVIVAIMGVETFYGKYKGNISVLDSLYTLGFNYPSRGDFFRQEFAQYIKLSERQGWKLTETQGSYAGAMGLGQFISSSYTHYGVDFADDGKVDMLNNPVDAIGSIANYFSKHEWITGAPVAYPVKADSKKVQELLSSSLKIKHTWADLTAAGVVLKESDDRVPAITIKDTSPAKLLKLQQLDNDEYWVYLDNFYSITRYNHSSLYAMAVFQLSEKIKQAKYAQ